MYFTSLLLYRLILLLIVGIYLHSIKSSMKYHHKQVNASICRRKCLALVLSLFVTSRAFARSFVNALSLPVPNNLERLLHKSDQCPSLPNAANDEASIHNLAGLRYKSLIPPLMTLSALRTYTEQAV
ncbi:uncharacterized protein GGS25DRAFT_137603 [Hypoxylon fragiforme]|uniref:uncharacterized protein n=1 Tax=Hypoxylon fragiforme TaxID=63214 RepID=UPI0020C699B5|nr:uncharacterized protein GGS25DRAFT_137603 [Hypoxylon fragiforme]KAI2612834.1 hypothetical protein GGS25DRAFT_137603 [Hypoxylon fragiforme]